MNYGELSHDYFDHYETQPTIEVTNNTGQTLSNIVVRVLFYENGELINVGTAYFFGYDTSDIKRDGLYDGNTYTAQMGMAISNVDIRYSGKKEIYVDADAFMYHKGNQ